MLRIESEQVSSRIYFHKFKDLLLAKFYAIEEHPAVSTHFIFITNAVEINVKKSDQGQLFYIFGSLLAFHLFSFKLIFERAAC